MRFIFFPLIYETQELGATASTVQFVVTRCGFALEQDYRNWDDTCLPAHLLQGEATRERGRETQRTKLSGNLYEDAMIQPKERWPADRYPLPAVTPRLPALITDQKSQRSGSTAPPLVPPCCKKTTLAFTQHTPCSLQVSSIFPGQQSHCELEEKVRVPTQGSHAGTYCSSRSLKATEAKQ